MLARPLLVVPTLLVFTYLSGHFLCTKRFAVEPLTYKLGVATVLLSVCRSASMSKMRAKWSTTSPTTPRLSEHHLVDYC